MEIRDRYNNIFLRIVGVHCYDNSGRWAFEKKGDYICNAQGYWVYKIIGDRVYDSQNNWVGNLQYAAPSPPPPPPPTPAPVYTGRLPGDTPAHRPATVTASEPTYRRHSPITSETSDTSHTSPGRFGTSPRPGIAAPPKTNFTAKKQPKSKNIFIIIAATGAVIFGVFLVFIIFTELLFSATFRSMGFRREPPLPYEVITFGRYDFIFYFGDGRFYVGRDNDRWGIVDARGNEIIPFGRYDYFMDASPGGGILVSSGGSYIVFDAQGNQLASFDRFDGVQYVTDDRFIANIISGETNRAALIDAQGNEIIPFGRYNNIWAAPGGKWFTVWDGNRIGLLDAQGNEVIPLGRYDDIQIVHEDRFIVSSWPNFMDFFDAPEADYEDAEFLSPRWAVLDTAGREVIPHGRFDWITDAAGHRFIVTEGRRTGVLDTHGNEIIPLRHERIWPAGYYFFVVRDGGRYGVLDARGQELIPPGRYDEILYVSNGHFLVRSEGDRCEDTWEWLNARWAIVDSRGREVIAPGRYDEIIAVSADRFIVRIGGALNTRTWQIEGARWGVLDASGSEIIPIGRYDRISRLGQYSFIFHDAGDNIDFIVNAGDRVGVRCADGYEIIPLGRYERIRSIHGRLAIVNRGGRVGVINIDAIE